MGSNQTRPKTLTSTPKQHRRSIVYYIRTPSVWTYAQTPIMDPNITQNHGHTTHKTRNHGQTTNITQNHEHTKNLTQTSWDKQHTHLLVVHVIVENAAADPHGPQELVDVVTRVARHAAEDDQHVVHVQRLSEHRQYHHRQG